MAASPSKNAQLRAQRDARRVLVLQYTLAGATTREIAETLRNQGIEVSHATVATDRSRVISEMIKASEADAEKLRALFNARYERLIASRWSKALAGDNKAVDLILRTMEAQRKINGVDAPAKIEHSGEIGSGVQPRRFELIIVDPHEEDPECSPTSLSPE